MPIAYTAPHTHTHVSCVLSERSVKLTLRLTRSDRSIVASAHILIDLGRAIKQLCNDYSPSLRFSSKIRSPRLKAFRISSALSSL